MPTEPKRVGRPPQTHCARGHSLTDPANVREGVNGRYRRRECRKCGVIRQQKHRGSHDKPLVTQDEDVAT